MTKSRRAILFFLILYLGTETNVMATAFVNRFRKNSGKIPSTEVLSTDGATSTETTSVVTSTDAATLPRPGSSFPTSVNFHRSDSSDGPPNWWVTYLSPPDATSLSRRLYATRIPNDVEDTTATGVENSSTILTLDLLKHVPSLDIGEDGYTPEEKMRRERLRMMETGVTSYSWASNTSKSKCDNGDAGETYSRRMLVPLGGALWILDDPLGSSDSIVPRKIVETLSSCCDDVVDDIHSLPPGSSLLDAKISADGSKVAFVAGDEVYVVSGDINENGMKNVPVRLTFGARNVPGATNGIADFLAQEELERRDGFWLSPCGDLLAFESVDESHINPYRIVHQGEALPSVGDSVSCGMVTVEETRYPFAGEKNPKVKLGVVSTVGARGAEGEGKGSDVIWFDLETGLLGDDFYLGRVEWIPSVEEGVDSTKLAVQLVDRRQEKLMLLLCDSTNGEVTTLHLEEAIDGGWINLNECFRPFPSPNISEEAGNDLFRFLWASERDGYSHLYVLEASLADGGSANARKGGAKVVQRLTGPGEFVVENVVDIDIDEDGVSSVYYMGTIPDRWLERHLFRASIDIEGGEKCKSNPECLTEKRKGQHFCTVSIKAGLYVDTVSSADTPPITTVLRLPKKIDQEQLQMQSHLPEENDAIILLHSAAKADTRVSQFGRVLRPPTFHRINSLDNKVILQAALYLPDEESFGSGPYPLVVYTYGGPHVQFVQDAWTTSTADMRSQFLRTNGFAVLKLDNRGSSRRGLAFEMPIRKRMGEVEVDDQVAGVKWAITRKIADASRVAVSGWSYGGYMALKCLSDRPDVFQSAVSGAPVTDWMLYDTAYTERYNGLPAENAEGYLKSSALVNIKNIEGSLLLCHGLLDENVLFRHSAVLINALIEHQKPHDIVIFPSERHSPRRQQDRAFLEERILSFLRRSLNL